MEHACNASRYSIRRRELLSAIAAVTLVPGARPAAEAHRKLGILMSTAENDPGEQALIGSFLSVLGSHGWAEGRNLDILYRWGAGDPERMEANARDLAARAPDVILAKGANLPALKNATSTIPVVFVFLSDTTLGTYAAGFPHPGGNVTGFASNERALVGKRLQLLHDIDPRLTRVLYLSSKVVGAGAAELTERAAQDAAALGMRLTDGSVESETGIEPAVRSFASAGHGGVVAGFNAFTTVHRHEIIALAERYRLPAVYPLRAFAADGGLVSYAFDQGEEFRQAADYVARILEGEKPADLPVQEPTKFDLVINLKTAKALGFTIPTTLLATADEVIE